MGDDGVSSINIISQEGAERKVKLLPYHGNLTSEQIVNYGAIFRPVIARPVLKLVVAIRSPSGQVTISEMFRASGGRIATSPVCALVPRNDSRRNGRRAFDARFIQKGLAIIV